MHTSFSLLIPVSVVYRTKQMMYYHEDGVEIRFASERFTILYFFRFEKNIRQFIIAFIARITELFQK